MPIFKSVATGLAGRRMGQQLGRRIPNPILRFAVVTAATTLAPMVLRRVQAAWERRNARLGAAGTTPRSLPSGR